MKQVKFSLQAILVLREQQEQAALQEYGRTLMAREQAITELRFAHEELAQAWSQFQDRLAAKCPAAELAQVQHWCQALEQRVLELDATARQARIRAKEAFFRLLAARQARTLLEQLAEKQKKRHQRAQRKKEEKALDDLPHRPSQLAELIHLNHPSVWN